MMIPHRRCAPLVVVLLLLLLLFLSSILLATAADEDDVRCLKGVRDSLSGSTGKLNWNFSNTTVGFVCSFMGISCWNPQENHIIDLSLPFMSLSGTIPSALMGRAGPGPYAGPCQPRPFIGRAMLDPWAIIFKSGTAAFTGPCLAWPSSCRAGLVHGRPGPVPNYIGEEGIRPQTLLFPPPTPPLLLLFLLPSLLPGLSLLELVPLVRGLAGALKDCSEEAKPGRK